MSELEAGGAPAPAEATAIDTAPPPVGTETTKLDLPKEEPKQPTIDDTLSAAWDKAQTGNERGTDGKFVSNKPAEPEIPVQAPTEAVEPAPPAIDPPQSWTAEQRAHWAKLPPETQEYILKRESETHKAISEQGSKLKSYEPFEKLTAEYKEDFARHAVAPEAGLRALLEAQRMFDRDPVGAATTLLLQRGIDIRPLLAGQQGQVPIADPRVGQLDQTVRSLEQRLQQTLQEQRAQQEAADAAVVNEFAKDKPYFEDVRVLMASLMKEGHAETLQSAYDMAVRAHPTVAKRIDADQRKAAEEKRKAEDAKKQEELRKKAEDASKAARVNVKSGTAHPQPKTMDDTLEELGRRAYG